MTRNSEVGGRRRTELTICRASVSFAHSAVLPFLFHGGCGRPPNGFNFSAVPGMTPQQEAVERRKWKDALQFYNDTSIMDLAYAFYRSRRCSLVPARCLVFCRVMTLCALPCNHPGMPRLCCPSRAQNSLAYLATADKPAPRRLLHPRSVPFRSPSFRSVPARRSA